MLALLGTSFTYLMTALGAATEFFFARKVCERAQGALLGFAAGVMMAASVWSLILPAIEQTEAEGRLPPFLPAAAGIVLGALTLFLLDESGAGTEPAQGAALAQAELGIATGQGSDIAIDVEKVTILSSDLTKIAAAVRLSAATVRTGRQNLFWAFIYNLIGVPVAAGVLYPLTRILLN